MDPVFDPAGIAWQPVSQALTKARLWTWTIWMAFPILAALVLTIVFKQWWIAAIGLTFVALYLWISWVIRRQVAAIGYAEREDDFLVKKGVLFKSISVVPYGRMQMVDVDAGPLDRKFGIAKVSMHTASASSDAVVPGLPPEEAARLRDRLASRGEARLAGL